MPIDETRAWTAYVTAALLMALALATSACSGTAPRSAPASSARGPAVAAAAEPTSALEPTASVEIGWVGDTLVGSRYGLAPRGGRALFQGVVAELAAPDLMVGNLEGTLSTAKRSKLSADSTATAYAFQAPPSYAAALAWAGFDVMSLANNHAHDYLELGLGQTREALDFNGIAYTGLPGQITVREAGGVKVAFLAFSPYRWNADIGDLPGAQALVRQAAGQADVVVVLMHAGAEGAGRTRTPLGAEKAFGEFRGDPRAFAHAVVDAGADVVFGSGPHVVRGIERYRGKLIAYSLGNFAAWGGFNRAGVSGLSGLITVRIDRDGNLLEARWLSLKLVGRGVPVIDARYRSLALVRRLSEQDFADHFAIDATGTIAIR